LTGVAVGGVVLEPQAVGGGRERGDEYSDKRDVLFIY
jgi:hypothetical protein